MEMNAIWNRERKREKEREREREGTMVEGERGEKAG